MKSMLPNKDELIIRYAMDELDPSERVVVENAMQQDENLLIEVESIKSTYSRCRTSLPTLQAPQHLMDAVLNTAKEHSEANTRKAPVRYLVFRRISYAAAATVLLSAGVSWYYATGTSELVPVESTELRVAPVELQTPANAPWIDNQNILHLNTAGFGSVATTPDSTPTRLRPVEEVTGSSRPARQLQLTGTQ